LRSPRHSTYATVAALLLALALLAGMIVLAYPNLHPSFSFLYWPVFIPTIGGLWQMEYRQVIAAWVIGLLLLASIGYFIRRRLRDRLARQQESREAEIQPETLAIAYRHKLMAQLSQLKVMDVAKPLDLETSYIPLRVRENPRLYFEGNEAAAPAFASPPLIGGIEAGKETMSPQEALVRFRHLALLGEPGAGKTTLLRHLAFQAAQGKLEGLPDFPIFISLSHFAAAAPQASLLDFVTREIGALYSSSAMRSYLEERLEEGSVLLLLDGLDEINSGMFAVSRPQETESAYRRVVGHINVLTARYPKTPVVVTSRRAGWKGLLTASFHILEVSKLGQDDIRRFIEDCFGQRGSSRLLRGSDRAGELQRTISQNPQVQALAANPLFLSLMALVFEQDGELPEGQAGLYRRGMELLLEKWGTHRGRKRISRFTAEHQRDLLEEVALHFHLRRLLCFPEEDLSGIMAGYLSAVGLPGDWVPTALERISAQYGLLRGQALAGVLCCCGYQQKRPA